MSNVCQNYSIEDWLQDIYHHISEQAPTLTQLLHIYAGEANFGRQYIEDDLKRLPKGANILELGAGSLLLSCQLVREGYNVTALEPIGDGFSHFTRLRELVLERAAKLGCVPDMLNQGAEELSISDNFDYAFSINVMEHVQDVAQVITNLEKALRHNATYRFTCPNYLFPYEPHFNMPILFSKKLTERIFKNRIFEGSTVDDATGTWNSLNWITVKTIFAIVRQHPGLSLSFNRQFLASTLERIGTDSAFAMRRSKITRFLITVFTKLQLHTITVLIPVFMHPGIDCSITKVASNGCERWDK